MEKKIEEMIKDEAVCTASKKIHDLKNEVEKGKDTHIDILRDALEDARQEKKFIKKITYILLIAVFCFIGAFIGLYLHSSNQLMEANSVLMDFLNSTKICTVEQSITSNTGDSNILGDIVV